MEDLKITYAKLYRNKNGDICEMSPEGNIRYFSEEETAAFMKRCEDHQLREGISFEPLPLLEIIKLIIFQPNVKHFSSFLLL